MEEKKKRRRKMRNEKRDKQKFIEDGSTLIKTALEAGFTTRSKISEATGLKLFEISKIFEINRELWSLYTIRRRSILDMATDNIEDIIMNKNHPQNFQASLHIIKNYKSDLDKGILDKKDNEEIAVEIQGSSKSNAPSVSITFTENKDK